MATVRPLAQPKDLTQPKDLIKPRRRPAMLPKFKVLFAGTLMALTLAAVPTFMPVLTSAAQAQGIRSEIVNQLNLTDAQQEQLQAIRQEARAQIEALLTPEQQATASAAFANGDSLREIGQQLDLSDEQRAQIRQVIRTHFEAASEILTEEQRQIARELLQEHRGQR
jgi:Spy/CpxP family protein refolding chaperone